MSEFRHPAAVAISTIASSQKLRCFHFLGGGGAGTPWRVIMLVSSRKAMRASNSSALEHAVLGVGQVAPGLLRQDAEQVDGLAGADDVDAALAFACVPPIWIMAERKSCWTRCSKVTGGSGPAPGFCARIRSSRRSEEAS